VTGAETSPGLAELKVTILSVSVRPNSVSRAMLGSAVASMASTAAAAARPAGASALRNQLALLTSVGVPSESFAAATLNGSSGIQNRHGNEGTLARLFPSPVTRAKHP
jgi:hypothetical protein